MGNRSNINLVGNTTQGQNVGDGAEVFKTKALGNLLQFRSISSTGDSIQIYEVDDKILISGASGGGGTITGTANYVSKFNSTGDNIEDSAIIDSGTTNMHLLKTCIITGRSIDTGVTIKAHDHPTSGVDLYLKPGCRLDYESGHQDGYLYLDPGRGVPYHAIYLGSPTYDKPNVFLQPYGTSTNMGLYVCGKGTSGNVSMLGGSSGTSYFGVVQSYINICAGGNLFMGTYNDFTIKGASTSATDSHGKNLSIVGGDGTGDGSSSGGTVIIRSGIGTVNDGRIRIDNLPLQSTETDVVYIDSSGRLSCGAAGGGGGTSYWSSGATGLSPAADENVVLSGSSTLSTDTGYQISGVTVFKTTSYSITNTAVGSAAMGAATAGNGNVAVGYMALGNVNDIGDYNTALGSYAMPSVYDMGDHNIGIGYDSLRVLKSGSTNIAIGRCSLGAHETGCCNVAIGRDTLHFNISGSRNVAIGDCAGYENFGSDKLHIANCSTCSLIIGDFVAKTICNGSNSTSWDTDSDSRIKECVETIGDATTTLSQLNPIMFNYTSGYTIIGGFDENIRVCNYGFLAQEFETVFPNYVKCSEGYISSGSTVQDFRTINDGHLVPILVKAIQELEARIQVLESQ